MLKFFVRIGGAFVLVLVSEAGALALGYGY
jgi:hypothetical protein